MTLKPARIVMQAAIEAAKSRQTPYGAALAMGDEVFTAASGQTRQKNDPSAHAAITAIRTLTSQLQKADLSGFTLYATCEPCPVCIRFAIGAGIKTVVFGCGISVISRYTDQKKGNIPADGNSEEIELIKDFMEAECEVLLQEYS